MPAAETFAHFIPDLLNRKQAAIAHECLGGDLRREDVGQRAGLGRGGQLGGKLLEAAGDGLHVDSEADVATGVLRFFVEMQIDVRIEEAGWSTCAEFAVQPVP